MFLSELYTYLTGIFTALCIASTDEDIRNVFPKQSRKITDHHIYKLKISLEDTDTRFKNVGIFHNTLLV
jgi:hypothetical protein